MPDQMIQPEKKSLSQIREEVFTEWSNKPGQFSPWQLEKEIDKRFNAQFPKDESAYQPWTEQDRAQTATPIPPTAVPPAPRKELEVLSARDLLNQQLGTQPWVIQQIMPAGEITLLSGSPGCGKSLLALYMAARVACGLPCFLSREKTSTDDGGVVAPPFSGFAVNRAVPVLYVDEENPKRSMQQRLQKITSVFPPEQSVTKLTTNLYFLSNAGIKIDNEESFLQLQVAVAAYAIEVLVIDTFLDIHSGEENSAKDIGVVYGKLKRLMATHNDDRILSILLLHHNRKLGQFERVGMESARGSIAIAGMVGSHIMVKSEWLENQRGITTILTQVKTRDITPFTAFEAKIEDNEEKTKTDIYFSKNVEERVSKMMECTDAIVEFIKQRGASTRKEIIKMLPDYAPATKDRAIKNLKERKILVSAKIGRSTYYNTNTQNQSNILIDGF